jgi:hypothetical protein
MMLEALGSTTLFREGAKGSIINGEGNLETRVAGSATRYY